MSEIDEMKIRQLDGTLLLVLRELLRRRKSTEVARRLGLSQSAVSHALGRLRELFDEPLFIRRPHGLEPTPHALALGPRIEALLEAAGDVFGFSTVFVPDESTRIFRVGAPEFLTALLAGPLFGVFREHAPSARFGFIPLLGEAALTALRRGEIDLAVGRFARGADGLQLHPLFTDAYCLVARRGHRGVTDEMGRAALRGLDYVAVSVGGDFPSPIEGELEDAGVSRRIVATVPRFLNAFLVVAASDAVTIAPQSLARAHASALGLQVRALALSLRPIRVVAATVARPDPGVTWLLERVREVACAPVSPRTSPRRATSRRTRP